VLNTIGLGGVPEAAYHLLRVLPRHRYDCRVFVMKRSSDEEEGREQRLQRFSDIGVPVTFARASGEKLSIASDLCGWLASERIDLLHTHSYKPNLYARLAGLPCRPEGLRMVPHYHNQYENKWQKDGSLTLERLLARESDGFIACSASVRDHVAQHVGVAAGAIDVVMNGVDGAQFEGVDPDAARAKLALPRNRLPVIAIVGRISQQKGQRDFLQAARLVANRYPDALFLVVGSADDEELLAEMHRLASELGLGDKVRFTGHVTDMPALYAALDVLVAPSRWEGFGLMLVEAMASGKPIVASAVGAIPEVVGRDAGLLVPPADPPAIAAAVESLIADPARSSQMGRAGRERARKFSWEASGERLAALYERVLGT